MIQKSLPAVLMILTVVICSAGFIHLNPINADKCKCVPVESYRIKAKHETDTLAYQRHDKVITATTMQGWAKTYAAVTKNTGKSKASKTMLRLKNCPEDSIYTFDGYIYRIRNRELDCDLHLECGPKNSTLRVGLEITREHCELQNQVLEKLKAAGFLISKENKKGVHIKARGLGFYDGWHKQWELHPVFSLEIVSD